MKNFLLLTTLVLIAISAQAQNSGEVIRLSEPVQSTDEFEVFGSELDYTELTPLSLSELIETEPENPVVLKTSVAQVCQKKGCFFIAKDEGLNARVTFKDYGFFIPTDSQGKEVILIGDFSVKILSEEKAKHYAEDAGEESESIHGTQKEYSVVATSIIVPKFK